MKKTLLFAATTPFAVNAFLQTHLKTLSEHFNLVLCVNTHAYPLNEAVRRCTTVVQIDFERKISPWRDARALVQMWRVCRTLHPDAIHSITPKAGLLAMLGGFLARVPMRCHTFTGQVWVNQRGVKRWLLKNFDRLIARLASHRFADSASQCRFLEAEAVVPPGSIHVLGKGSIAGVDLCRFRPDAAVRAAQRQQMGIKDSNLVFVFVGRLTRDKGLPDLVAAFTQVSRGRPDMQLWLVGPDEEGMQAALQAISQEAGNQIQWLGPTPDPEQYMAAADIHVLPSYREGFGSVIIEAAACGLPTIAYRIDGVVDAVVDGETGILVEVGRIPALVQAMTVLANDAAQLRQLGAQALERARSQFSAAVVTEEWQRFYLRQLAD